MAQIEALLILAVATLDLAVAARRIGSDQLVPDPQACGSSFEKGRKSSLGLRESIREFKTVIGLYTLHIKAVFFEERRSIF